MMGWVSHFALGSLVLVAATSCQRECSRDSDCKFDRVCNELGVCAFQTLYECNDTEVVVTRARQVVDRVECADFQAMCGPDEGISWCTHAVGPEACQHLYDDCGFVLLVDNVGVSRDACVETYAGVSPCETTCLALAACDEASLDSCFGRTTCPELPRNPEKEEDRPAPQPDPQPDPEPNCCRVCTTGRACGDACIAASSNCNQPPGCACNR